MKNYGIPNYDITTTPATPDPGFWKFYAKSDGFYQLDDAGVETKMVSSFAVNTINYISKSDGTGLINSLIFEDSGARIGIGTITPGGRLTVKGTGTGYNTLFLLQDSAGDTPLLVFDNSELYFNYGVVGVQTAKHTSGRWDFPNTVTVGGPTNTGIERFQIKGQTTDATAYGIEIQDSATNVNFYVRNDGVVNSRLGYWFDGNRILQGDAINPTNIFLGYYNFNSVPSNTGTGVYAIGFGAGQSNSGSSVIAIGADSGASNSGSYVVGLGWTALQNNTGSSVFAIGLQSAYNNIGSNVLAIGNYSAKDNTISNAAFIGTSGTGGVVGYLDVYIGTGVNRTTETIHYVNLRQGTAAVGETDKDMSNAPFNIVGAVGTGTGLGGDIYFKVSKAAAATGTTQNALINAFRLKQSGYALFNDTVDLISFNNTLFFGNGAGNTVGSLTNDHNIGIGRSTLSSLNGGYQNVGVGSNVFQNVVTGGGNVGMGYVVGFNTTGSSNTLMGYSSMFTSTTGSGNSYFGTQTGADGNGSFNVFLGYYAGKYETGSNTLIIDNTNRVTEAASRTSALIYGVFDFTPANQTLTFNAKVGVGALTPSARLHVVGYTADNTAYTIKAYDSATNLNFYVQNDGAVNSRKGYWILDNKMFHLGATTALTDANYFIGYASGFNHASGSFYNVGIGYGTLSSIVGASSQNIAIGYIALQLATTATQNIAIGYGAMASITTVGVQNIGIGLSALGNGTGGSQNVAIGMQAAQFTTGDSNTAVGWRALYQNTSGTANSIFGFGAMGGNTGSATTGSYNSVFGMFSFTNHTAGDSNTAIGYQSGFNNLTGTDNVFLGFRAGHYETSSNKLFIDNQSRTDEATSRLQSIVYGEFNATIHLQRLTINGLTRIHNFTVANMGAASPLNGDITYVTDTDGTFTAKGFWGYEEGAWVKL